MSEIHLDFLRSDGGRGPRSLTSAVLERLRADILTTALLPGQKLNVASLAKQFSVSLAAVREALSRLVADGLVQASDQRGFRVSPVSQADLEDVTQTRIDIEGLALRRSIERGDAAWLNSAEKEFAALSAIPFRNIDGLNMHNETWVVQHRSFHRALVNAASGTSCTSKANVIADYPFATRTASRATSRPSTSGSWRRFGGAMSRRPLRRCRIISRQQCNS